MNRFQFHPVVARWFEEKFGSPTEPQERGWPAIQSGAHTLIAAPTGSGKTLSAFLAALDSLFRDAIEDKLPDEVRVVYVSPLKALSNDIHKNLEEPLAGLRAAFLAAEGKAVHVRAAVRTGDTSPAARQALTRKPPHILVTTPESLYLLLTSVSGRQLLGTVRTLIVDEIHALVANRRGSHLALTMERLRALVKAPLQRIGLSATQKPIESVARFLVGTREVDSQGHPRCLIIDAGWRRNMNVAIELPSSPLEAVMSHEVWDEIYNRLAELIGQHRTTLIFVNTRRLAERVTHHLNERVGKDKVTSHHGSLSAKLRLDAENRLKQGELKALVATASLELGIDIGSVDLVCQVGPTRSIATLIQRIGRAHHQRGGLPKGRIFPLSRDELVECLATVRCLRRGEMDALQVPEKPLDVLAQQLVACAAAEDWAEDDLFELVRAASPYATLTRVEFDDVLQMLAEGFSTKRGRRAALIHHDAINRRVRGRRGARLIALTSGGAIPDNADYRVVVDPSETFIGTVNEDFAVESQAGDIFQLGNASWRILRVNSGVVRVEDAQGRPPSIPFWLGEAPGRTAEVSRAVSDLRREMENQLAAGKDLAEWAREESGVSAPGAQQLADYFGAAFKVLGALPSQEKLVLERFFDESGGMQLVIHSPFGIRVNRAWGLALRKRFCRSFNFELQAAATDEAIVLSLGTQHSFALDDVYRYLKSKSVRDLLIQALFDAPMFQVHWRWNVMRALALPRQRGGKKIAAPLQRMEAENLLAAIFPDQLACLENIVGDRQIPEHPLVRQTIDDCLTEVMDIDGLIDVLKRIETGSIECLARDLPEPSPLAHEILNARPYAFLDNAPLEERRTQAVYTRRSSEAPGDPGLGVLDAAAIDKVRDEAWPHAENADELHELLLLLGLVTESDLDRASHRSREWLETLVNQKRAGRLNSGGSFWLAAERLPLVRAVFLSEPVEPALTPPVVESKRSWERSEALRELVRGRMEVSGPITVGALVEVLRQPKTEIDAALLALEAEGFVLRGKFTPGSAELEWCERRLLARVHRLTLHRLRAEIQPVSQAEFQRFLAAWQRVDAEHRAEGPEGLAAVVQSLDGHALPAAAWEPEILAARVREYSPVWLDQLCSTGRVGWGRLALPQGQPGRSFVPVRSTPVSLFMRENLSHWLGLAGELPAAEFSPDTTQVHEVLSTGGAQFFGELVRRAHLLPSRVEQGLAELAAQGWVTSDNFEGLRALLVPLEKRLPFVATDRPRHYRAFTAVDRGGRWSLLRTPGDNGAEDAALSRDEAIEAFARALLHRYGVIFRRLIERESLPVSWFELGRVYRRLEARGEIRGGFFVAGVSGEQFALAEAIGLLRTIRKAEPKGEWIAISAADPLNLSGILTPGSRVPAFTGNRILLRDGSPVAALIGSEVKLLDHPGEAPDAEIERLLLVGSMPGALRPYYA
jgi:ATP-dependent Lhr-like helicase